MLVLWHSNDFCGKLFKKREVLLIVAFKSPNTLLPQPTNRAITPIDGDLNNGAEIDDDMDINLIVGNKKGKY